MKMKSIPLSEEECACILVGLNEFDARIYEAKSGCFDAYKKINPALIEKFRKVCWEFHHDRQAKLPPLEKIKQERIQEKK